MARLTTYFVWDTFPQRILPVHGATRTQSSRTDGRRHDSPILAALTAVSVTGSTTTSRSVTRASEITELQKAVERFSGVSAAYPTLSRAVADSERTEGIDFFRVSEGAEGINRDVNGDGDVADTINVIPVDWQAQDHEGNTFVPHYIAREPPSAAPADSVRINGSESEHSWVDEPWVIDEDGNVRVLVRE